MMIFHTNQAELPEWLLEHGPIIGAEGDESGDAGSDSSGSAGESQGSSNDDTGDDDSGDEDLPEGASELPDDHPVKKALLAERRQRKQAEKERKRLEREANRRKQEDDDRKAAEEGELAAERTKRERAEARAVKLAEGFRTSAVNAAIERAARDAKFIDVDDALAGVDRSKITVEQDEDEPQDITIDAKTVSAVVKELARRKPHLVRGGTSDGNPTGSQFGGTGKGGKKTDEETLKEQYPSLR